jgi:mitochondrial fission protein ELM1
MKIETSNFLKRLLQRLKLSSIWNRPGNATHLIFALWADKVLSTESSIAMHSEGCVSKSLSAFK